MTRPDSFLNDLDRIETRDLWPQIEQRRPGTEIGPPRSRLRRLSIIVTSLVITAVAIALLFVAIPGTNVPSPGSTPSSGVKEWKRQIDPQVELSAEVPTGWIVAGQNLTPWLTHPTEVFSAGTFDLPVSHDPNDPLRVFDAPVAPAALASMTMTDAFVSLQASGPNADPDDRPSSFEDAGQRSCCAAQTGDYPFMWWWIPFVEGNRGYYLFVAVGSQADAETAEGAWAIADSLRFVYDTNG
jgi:hypothetical protein